MKSLFIAADEVYKTGLDAVNRIADMKGTLPETRLCAARLARALAEYERSRFHRRKIEVAFECPMPLREISRRELTSRNRVNRLLKKLDDEVLRAVPIKKREKV